MKFIVNGSLWYFFADEIIMITPIGDYYRIKIDPYNGPFVQLLSKRNYHEDIEQLKFKRELKGIMP